MKTKSVISFLIVMMVLVGSLPARAYASGEGTWVDYLQDIGTKFGRGLWDVLSSPAEIPCQMAVDMEDQPAVGFFKGLGIGTGKMLRRILSGVTEVGTFMIPMERIIPPVCHESTP